LTITVFEFGVGSVEVLQRQRELAWKKGGGQASHLTPNAFISTAKQPHSSPLIVTTAPQHRSPTYASA